MPNETYEIYPEICHYTKIQTAKEIINSKIIRASHYSKLNDLSELKYSKNLIGILLKDMNNITFTVDDLFKALGKNVYIASFCTLDHEFYNNDDGILSMWRYYGDYESCYIVFDSYDLFQKAGIKASEEGGNFSILFDEIGYKVEDKKLNDIFEKYTNNFKKILQKHTNINNIDMEFVIGFLHAALLIKHPAFFEEKEIRLGIVPKLPEKDPASSKIEEQPFKDYIEVPFGVNSIKKIVISPGQNQDRIISDLKNFISHQGYNINVTGSKIPTNLHKTSNLDIFLQAYK